MRNKPQKGNHLNGCHSGPYNQNLKPSSVYKLPYLQRQGFFKQEVTEPVLQKNDLAMNVETLIAALQISSAMS